MFFQVKGETCILKDFTNQVLVFEGFILNVAGVFMSLPAALVLDLPSFRTMNGEHANGLQRWKIYVVESRRLRLLAGFYNVYTSSVCSIP